MTNQEIYDNLRKDRRAIFNAIKINSSAIEKLTIEKNELDSELNEVNKKIYDICFILNEEN